MEEGHLKKMKIIAYSTPTYGEGDQIEDGEFTVQVNPESYAFNYKVEYGRNQAPGTSSVPTQVQ